MIALISKNIEVRGAVSRIPCPPSVFVEVLPVLIEEACEASQAALKPGSERAGQAEGKAEIDIFKG